MTYRELHEYICKFANVLKANGVQKGDRVAIYLPVGLQGAAAMLACAVDAPTAPATTEAHRSLPALLYYVRPGPAYLHA